jgi:hypothetical protein
MAIEGFDENDASKVREWCVLSNGYREVGIEPANTRPVLRLVV